MNEPGSGIVAVFVCGAVASGRWLRGCEVLRPWLIAGILLLSCTVDAGPDTELARDAYKLGPGDHIRINVFGEPDLSMEFRLNDTGTLNYPFLGEIDVTGSSVTELERTITQGLKGRYLVSPDVTVSITEYRSFYVNGEVRSPGGFPYEPGLTLQKAIALGGGFTERAAKNKITVIRASEVNSVARPIGLNDRVYPGDVITVPQSFF